MQLQQTLKLEDGKCMYDGIWERSMVVYELKCLIKGKSYVGKTQRTLKTRTKEHINDTWAVISIGRTKFGKKWFGSGGYAGADVFSEHFGNLFRSCYNSNQTRQRLNKNDSDNSLARRRNQMHKMSKNSSM